MNDDPIIVEQTYHAPIEKVWQALTDNVEMKQWYFDIADFKPEVGHEFQFEGGTEDKTYLHLCKVTLVEPLKKIQYSWRYDGYDGISFVTFELFKEGEDTRVKLTHEGLESFPSDNPDFAKKNFNEGWNSILSGALKTYVEKEV